MIQERDDINDLHMDSTRFSDHSKKLKIDNQKYVTIYQIIV